MASPVDVEATVRARLRGLRQSLGWTLDELGERSHLSASTISRIETGKRTIGLDVLLALARALQVNLDRLLDVEHDDDVVIRPVPSSWGGTTTWPLSRPTSTTTAVKIRLEPGTSPPEPQVHPGHDWLFVLSGTVHLALGERHITVQEGEAAEFTTMTPHAVTAVDGPAELLMVFDGEGRRAHLHHGTEPSAY